MPDSRKVARAPLGPELVAEGLRRAGTRSGSRQPARGALRPRAQGRVAAGPPCGLRGRGTPKSGRLLPRLHDPWPICRCGTQTGADWVHPDIVGLFDEFFIGSQPVIEIAILPANAGLVFMILLPVAKYATHGDVLRKREYRVQVVRHQHKQPGAPAGARVIKRDGRQ